MRAIITQNKKSEYVILIPKGNSSIDKVASENFNKLLKLVTGVELPVVEENDAPCDKIVSIGDTQALKDAKVERKYGKGGVGIVEKEGNLFIFGEGYSGAVFAVQVFFEQVAGYKFFAKDEFCFDKKDTLSVDGLEYYYTPTIPNRGSGFALCRTDREYATGLKAYAFYGERADGTSFWGTWAHNHFVMIPPDKYADAHPEWFNEKKNQLCLSNMEMRDEFFKNFVEHLKTNTTQTHFMLGHQDNYDFCYCEKCREKINKIGTGGLCMEFINDIAIRTEKWRQENCPEREISVGTLAYSLETSIVPPVKKVGDEYLPVSDSVVAQPNVFISFAPMDAIEHSRPLTDEINKEYYSIFKKWNVISKRLCNYMYFGSFRRCFEIVDGIYIFKQNVNALKELGCETYFVENNSNKNSIFFQAMHLYVLTSMEWNGDRDTDEVIDEFMSAYYKCAKKPMREFFDYCISYWKKVRERSEYFNGKKYTYGMCLTDTIADGFWSLNALYDLNLILDKADKLIDEGDYEDEMKQKLHDRVELERLCVICAELEYFANQMSPYAEARTINAFTKESAMKLLDRFEKGVKKFNIPKVDGDGKTAFDTIARWREEIENSARGWENRIKSMHEKIYDLFGEDK